MGNKPKPPDPVAVANAQARANRETAITQQQLNMVNQQTPWGSLTYTQVGTHPDGTPKFQATTTLSPEQQALLNNQTQFQTQLGSLGLQQLGALEGTLGTPLDLSDPTIGSEIMARYSPQFEEQRARDRAALESDLTNRGIRLGSTAYNNALAQFDERYGDRENALMRDARAQTVQEMLAQRNQPLTELSVLMGQSAPSGPNFQPTPQTGVANTDVMGPIYQNYQAQMDAYNNRLQGLFGLGSALLGGWALSEPKTKEKVHKVGELDNGMGVYSYRYKDKFGGGLMQLGVMADEAQRKVPEAVAEVAPGIRAVNYSELAEALGERAA